MIGSLLLALPVLACDDAPHDVLAITPEHGAEGVPRDTRVVLQVRGEDAVGEPTLVGPSGTVSGSWTVEDIEGGVDALWTFVPDAPLDGSAWYGLAAVEAPAADPSAGTSWNASFFTGDGFGEPTFGAPLLDLLEVGQATDGVITRCEPARYRRVIWTVTPTADPRPAEAWFLLALQDAGADRLLEARRLDSRAWDAPAEILVPTEGGPFCLVAIQRSASGDEVRSEPACFTPGGPATLPVAADGSAGCAHGSAPGALAVLALAGVCVRRRRARG